MVAIQRVKQAIAGVALAAILAGGTLPAAAATWTVDHKKSSISFGGQHMGREFTGRFNGWTADIRFDPAKPADSRVRVVIDLASAKTGDAMYDKTLPTADWFDTAKTRQAVFEAASVRQKGPNAYEADGKLTIRGKSVPVRLPFTLKINGKSAVMDGKVVLKRTAWGIGQGSDAAGEWVSLDIPVQVHVEAVAK